MTSSSDIFANLVCNNYMICLLNTQKFTFLDCSLIFLSSKTYAYSLRNSIARYIVVSYCNAFMYKKTRFLIGRFYIENVRVKVLCMYILYFFFLK